VGTGPPDIAVRQESAATAAVELFNGPLQDITPLIELLKDFLDDFGLNRGGGTAELIKSNMEPTVDIGVDRIIPVAEFPGAYPLLGGPGFRGGAVLIGTADIEGIVAPEPAKPGKDIGGEDLDKVPQVGYVIDIGKCGSYQPAFHVFLL
jgi:hypothetical protein